MEMADDELIIGVGDPDKNTLVSFKEQENTPDPKNVTIPDTPLEKIVFNANDPDPENRRRSINMALIYVCFLREPELILKSQLARQSIEYVAQICGQKKLRGMAINFSKTGFDHILLQLLQYLYANVLTHVGEILERHIPDEVSHLNFQLEFIRRIVQIMINLTNRDIGFCLRLIELKGIGIILNYVTCPFMLEFLGGKVAFTNEVNRTCACYAKDKMVKPRLLLIARLTLGTLHNMSRSFDKSQDDCSEMNRIKLLLDIDENLQATLRNQFYLIYANIAQDDEIETLHAQGRLGIVVRDIAHIVELCVRAFAAKKKPTRANVAFEVDRVRDSDSNEPGEDGDEEGANANGFKRIVYCNFNYIAWHLVELLQALTHIATNDKAKWDIYMEHKLGDYLRLILENGNQIEVEFGLRLLWQLCFDKRVATDIREDNQFKSIIITICIDKSIPKKIARLCEGILWTLRKGTFMQPVEKETFRSVKEDTDEYLQAAPVNLPLTTQPRHEQHIMISYNRESREECLKIKNELEKDGYKVWIDVESMAGSTLESMAQAIEQSWCILMCMSQFYKNSSNCRAEAEYAFQMNKPIVPLIMQANYKPDGWLGILLGSKMFVNFKKYDWDECIRRLRVEITKVESTIIDTTNVHVKDVNVTLAQSVVKAVTHVTHVCAELEWTEQDVADWFATHNINTSILEALRPCNGHILKQLKHIYKTAPEFFYCALAAGNKAIPLNLRDIAIFTYELEHLFI